MTAQVFTLANQLTVLRVLLVPVFVLLMVYQEPGWALAVFLLAALTDLLDGLVARLTSGKTELGAWLDPAADKLLVGVTYVVLTLPNIGLTNKLPLWLTITVISRDIGIIVTVFIVNLAIGRRTFRPSTLGKVATASALITCVVVMFFNYLGRPSPLVDVAIWVSLAMTVISWVDYTLRIPRLINP